MMEVAAVLALEDCKGVVLVCPSAVTAQFDKTPRKKTRHVSHDIYTEFDIIFTSQRMHCDAYPQTGA